MDVLHGSRGVTPITLKGVVIDPLQTGRSSENALKCGYAEGVPHVHSKPTVKNKLSFRAISAGACRYSDRGALTLVEQRANNLVIQPSRCAVDHIKDGAADARGRTIQPISDHRDWSGPHASSRVALHRIHERAEPVAPGLGSLRSVFCQPSWGVVQTSSPDKSAMT